MYHKTTLNIPDATYRKARMASAAAGLTVSELIRAALDTALVAFAENDPGLAMYFSLTDSGKLRELESVPA